MRYSLWRRGLSGAGNAGLEPYCEALASELIHRADPASVAYSVLKLHGETATKCKAFTDEEVGFVSLRKLVDRSITLEELLEFFDQLACRDSSLHFGETRTLNHGGYRFWNPW